MKLLLVKKHPILDTYRVLPHFQQLMRVSFFLLGCVHKQDEEGRADISSSFLVTISCITYFILIFGGQIFMKGLPAFKLKIPFMIHNVLLTLVSGILLALMIEQIFPIIYHQGFLAAICAQSTWTQPLELLYYLNYLVKYWELIDTIFLVLKKKKLGKCFVVMAKKKKITYDMY